ncbi:MAG: hypothetical protein JXA20_00695 [Spirochaetes bacterium]|nr:hypothetical protein [Spirochaetota bacterium]
MKRILCLASAMVFACVLVLQAQEQGAKSTLTSEKLDKQEKDLDAQYLELTKRMEEIVKNYKLMEIKDIRIVPYQTDYRLGSDYIMIEKHTFIKDDERPKEVSGIKTKSIKIYTNGSAISKLEYVIYEKQYYSGVADKVTIVDPSPTSGGMEDIIFTHERRGKYLMKDQKMKDIKNTTAYPIRNELRQLFMIPNLAVFNNALLVTAEGYYQSLKDTDAIMMDFLKSSTKY